MTDLPPPANTVVGLLADPDRRRMLAAIELGATTLDEATRAAGLPEQRAARAFGKLVDAGVVVASQGAGHVVDGGVFAEAARNALARRRDEHDAEPPDVKRVLDAFVRDGRITSMPTAPAKRRILLDWLARRSRSAAGTPRRTSTGCSMATAKTRPPCAERSSTTSSSIERRASTGAAAAPSRPTSRYVTSNRHNAAESSSLAS